MIPSAAVLPTSGPRVLATLANGRRAQMSAAAYAAAFGRPEPVCDCGIEQRRCRCKDDAPASASVRTLPARLYGYLLAHDPADPLPRLAEIAEIIGGDSNDISKALDSLRAFHHITEVRGARANHRGERVVRIVDTGAVLRSAGAPPEWVA